MVVYSQIVTKPHHLQLVLRIVLHWRNCHQIYLKDVSTLRIFQVASLVGH